MGDAGRPQEKEKLAATIPECERLAVPLLCKGDVSRAPALSSTAAMIPERERLAARCYAKPQRPCSTAAIRTTNEMHHIICISRYLVNPPFLAAVSRKSAENTQQSTPFQDLFTARKCKKTSRKLWNPLKLFEFPAQNGLSSYSGGAWLAGLGRGKINEKKGNSYFLSFPI